MRPRSFEAGELSVPIEVQDGHRRIRVQWANVEPLSAYQRCLEPVSYTHLTLPTTPYV